MTLEEQFHEVALKVYEEGKLATGYRGTRYLQKVRKDGGLSAAKTWLKKKKGNDAPTGGFLKLVEYGRLDVSLEARVVEKPWMKLFTDEEIEVAKNRLKRYGYFIKDSFERNDDLLPGEEKSTRGIEGHVQKIYVNRYERKPKLRKACLQHYGSQCFVCGITFESVYGSVASDFIHVHHLCPLSELDSEYEVDAIADLRPVCPNCHAVIHMKSPPYKIEQVKEMINSNK